MLIIYYLMGAPPFPDSNEVNGIKEFGLSRVVIIKIFESTWLVNDVVIVIN